MATPHDNPFGSLLAIYAVIEDPRAGILVKLPGKVEADPNTGRLISTFDNNPQLPFSHFKLSFFGGAHGVAAHPGGLRQLLDHRVADPVVGTGLRPAGTRPETTTRSHAPPSGGALPAASLPNNPSLDAGVSQPGGGQVHPLRLAPAPPRRLPADLLASPRTCPRA